MRDGGRGHDKRTATVGIAWHHTATFYAAAKLTPADEWAHVQMIELYHINQGYVLFGYHGIAFASGRAYLTGDLDGRRSHVANRNHELIGFCVAGDYSNSHPPDDALRALKALRTLARNAYPTMLPEKGHTDWAVPTWPTSCPGARRAEWIPRIATIADSGDEGDDEMQRTFVRMTGRVQVYEVVGGRLVHVPTMATVAPATDADVREHPPNHVVWTLPAEYRSVPRQLGGPADVGP